MFVLWINENKELAKSLKKFLLNLGYRVKYFGDEENLHFGIELLIPYDIICVVNSVEISLLDDLDCNTVKVCFTDEEKDVNADTYDIIVHEEEEGRKKVMRYLSQNMYV